MVPAIILDIMLMWGVSGRMLIGILLPEVAVWYRCWGIRVFWVSRTRGCAPDKVAI